jgi:site-specific DNA-cytosine methylase
VGELKGKSKRKDNAEAQRALRFAEKKEEDYAEFAEKRRGAKKEERRKRSEERGAKRDSSLRGPTRQKAARKKKSGRFVRNDGAAVLHSVVEGLTPEGVSYR